MIEPDGLLAHARRLAGSGRGRPPDADLRRGISAAYYAVFHDLTERAARHLVGSAPDEIQHEIRRTWRHGDLSKLGALLIERSKQLQVSPIPPLSRELSDFGPLADLAAADGNLIEALRRFNELQELRHAADYDHEAKIDKATLLAACEDADHVRARMNDASPSACEALFTMIVVGQQNMRSR